MSVVSECAGFLEIFALAYLIRHNITVLKKRDSYQMHTKVAWPSSVPVPVITLLYDVDDANSAGHFSLLLPVETMSNPQIQFEHPAEFQGRSQWAGLRGLGPPYEKVVYFFLVSSFLCVKYQGCSLGLERLSLEAVSRRFLAPPLRKILATPLPSFAPLNML